MDNEKEKVVEFKGTVVKNLYKSDNYMIYAMEVDNTKYDVILNSYRNLSITGDIGELAEDVEYTITAREKDSKYGKSYDVINIVRDMPTTGIQVLSYLEEVLTSSQANVLYEHYPNIIDIVKEGRVNEIDVTKLKGIGKKSIEKIAKKIEDNFVLMDLMTIFKNTLTITMVKKIYDKYHSVEILIKHLSKEPYSCLCNIGGIGFKKADSILLGLVELNKEDRGNGIVPIINLDEDLLHSDSRCKACVKFCLDEHKTSTGSTKMNVMILRNLCVENAPECIDHFDNVIKDELFKYDEDTLDISLAYDYNTEYRIAKTIVDSLSVGVKEWEVDVENFRNLEDFPLSDEQLGALSNLCKYPISLLIGNAGSGKSASTKSIINFAKNAVKTILLLSPTGKAAKVLSEYTGRNAKTIQRGLGYTYDGFNYNEDNKLREDIIIVDEFSMVDIYLFNSLIKAIDFSRTRLVLIGDNAQLPSIGCGNLLHDFIVSNIIPKTLLTKVFRYGSGGLMTVATDTRNSIPYLPKECKNSCMTFGENKDYMFIDVEKEDTVSNILSLYRKLVTTHSVSDIQVLTSVNKGEFGVYNLNNELQKIANRNYLSGNFLKCGDTIYYEDDLVMQIENNYKAYICNEDGEYISNSTNNKDDYVVAFVANGESGVICKIDLEDDEPYMIIDFDGILVRYASDELRQIALGYACTIHKSQGSGINIPILCTPKSHYFNLNSNLLYVALTRMKGDICYHIGSYYTINSCVKKKANLERDTYMQTLLHELYKE